MSNAKMTKAHNGHETERIARLDRTSDAVSSGDGKTTINQSNCTARAVRVVENLPGFDLENEGQGHGVQHFHWSHSMANINLYEGHTCAFFACSHHFRDIHISKFVNLKCRSRS